MPWDLVFGLGLVLGKKPDIGVLNEDWGDMFIAEGVLCRGWRDMSTGEKYMKFCTELPKQYHLPLTDNGFVDILDHTNCV